MEPRPSDNFRGTLLFAVGLGALLSLASPASRTVLSVTSPLWRNIYLWSAAPANPYGIGFGVFLIIVCVFNAAAPRPRRLWRAGLVLAALLAGVLLAASAIPRLLPRVGVFDSAQAALAGLGFGLLLVDGTPARVWRALVTKGTDYAGRFFPATGFLLCLAFLGLWGQWLLQHCIDHDLTATLDRLCFILGMVCVMIAGRRRDITLPAAIPIEA